MTFLTRAEAVAWLQRPETPKRVDIWDRRSYLPDPCVFCDAAPNWVIKLQDERDEQFSVQACHSCHFAFMSQVDPMALGGDFPTSRVLAVLRDGVA